MDLEFVKFHQRIVESEIASCFQPFRADFIARIKLQNFELRKDSGVDVS